MYLYHVLSPLLRADKFHFGAWYHSHIGHPGTDFTVAIDFTDLNPTGAAGLRQGMYFRRACLFLQQTLLIDISGAAAGDFRMIFCHDSL